MIFLLTGANGGGKSLYSVKLIRDQLKVNKDPNALQYDDWIEQYELDEDDYLVPLVPNPKPLIRPIFSNIPGLNFDSDQVFTLPAAKDGMYDWSSFPFGSLIFDDECHRRIPATGKPGEHGDERVDKLDMHRHRGLDFYFITQFPNKLHHVVRNLVARHYHLQNIAGSQNASLFTWQYPEPNPNGYNERQSADKTVFHYDKSLFKHYKSSSLHTRKLSVPKKMWFLVAIFAFFGFRFVSSLASNGGEILHSDQSTSNIVLSEERAAAEVLAPSGSSRPVFSGCISNATQCTCYDEDFRPIDLDFGTCKNYMEEPLPIIPKIGKNA